MTDHRMTHLHRIDVMSRETKRLTEGNFTLADAGISPDGTEIAAVRRPTPKADDGSGSDIVLIPAEGGAPRVLFENSRTDTSPRFSPDGKTIAFLTRDGKLPRSGTNTLAIIPRAGGVPTRLTPVDLSPGAALWSKNGAAILFTATVGVEGRLYSVATTAQARAPRELMRGAFMVSSPTLSSDGAPVVTSLAPPGVAEFMQPRPCSPKFRQGQAVVSDSSP